jgi:hypothetical protein
MEITEQLQQLAKFSDHTFPVISLYIRTLWPDQLRRTESAAFLSTHLQQARSLTLEPEDTRQSLARDLARIEAWGAARLALSGLRLHRARHGAPTAVHRL